ncbi:MAG: Chromosome partitioning protein [Actinotalea sp.]|nr:Chromosome partitioning protein [Actinotalea sp.]
MELQDYLALARKRWVSILLVTVSALAGAIALTATATPTYEARSQVFVSVRTGGTTADLLQGSNFTQNQVASYKELVTSPRVLVPVIEQLAIATTPDELARNVRADAPLNSVLINITATDVDPALASDIANATAGSLATEVTALEQPEQGPSPVKISTVRTASVPTEPTSPDPVTNVALALLLGLVAGAGLALVREVLDTRIRGEADVRKVTDASVIATITHDDEASRTPLLVAANPQSQRSEAFRRLRTNLQFLDVSDDLRAMVVTSSIPGEGKSTTAINLAIMLADAGTRVLLIDGDLRRPSVAKYMGIEGSVGLTTVLIGRAAIQDVVQPWGSGQLHVLPSGQIPPNPSELLGSRTMAELLGTLGQRYDVIIIDTPPLLPVIDAAILARLTRGAIVVVGTHSLHHNQLEESLGALESVGARVLGIVLNRVPEKLTAGYQYYDYSLESQTRSKRQRRRHGSNPEGPIAPSAPPRGRSGREGHGRASTRRASEPSAALTEFFDAQPTSRSNRWPGEPLGR